VPPPIIAACCGAGGRGHAITFYEPDAFDRQQHRDIEPPGWARVVVYPATEAALRDVMARRRRPTSWSRPAASAFSTMR
jgi:hypothetical protein